MKRLDEIFDKIKTSYQVWTPNQRKVAEEQLLAMAKVPRENNRKRAKIEVAVGQILLPGAENKDNNTQTPIVGNVGTENRDESTVGENSLQTLETVTDNRDDSSWKQNLSHIAQIPPVGTENGDFGSMRQNCSEVAEIANLETENKNIFSVRPNLPDIAQVSPVITENRDFSSLKRNLLEMERPETPTKTRKCSNCGFTGHNKASCQKRFTFLSSLE